MKLQTINQSAFQKFEGNVLHNLSTVVGGRYQKTGAGSIPSQCMTYCCDIKDDEGVKPTIYYGAVIKPCEA